MPFLRFRQHKSIKSTAHSLRAYLVVNQGGQTTPSVCSLLKRVSSIIFRGRIFACRKGSMTLEAAFVLPFFLFALINILYAGNMLPDSLAGIVMSQVYARGQIVEYVGRDYLEQSCIKDGTQGLSMSGSSVMGEGDVIDLQVSYHVKPFSSVMGFDGFSMSQRYYGKAWTGYDVTRHVSDTKEEDPMVYVTQTGTVYHLDRNCTYLNPAVESLPKEAVSEERNQSGGKYYSCGVCDGDRGQGQVYVTSYGGSYHSRLNCSGLKRTIYTVALSETGGRRRCSKCG